MVYGNNSTTTYMITAGHLTTDGANVLNNGNFMGTTKYSWGGITRKGARDSFWVQP